MTLVYLPDSIPGPEVVTLAPSPDTLAGLRIAVLDNGKANADVVMTRAAETLASANGSECVAGHKERSAGRVGQRRNPDGARHHGTTARRSRPGDHRRGRLRLVHRLLGDRRDRVGKGGKTRRGGHDNQVRADRDDARSKLRLARDRASWCCPIRSAAPTKRRSTRGRTPRPIGSFPSSPPAVDRAAPRQTVT